MHRILHLGKTLKMVCNYIKMTTKYFVHQPQEKYIVTFKNTFQKI